MIVHLTAISTPLVAQVSITDLRLRSSCMVVPSNSVHTTPSGDKGPQPYGALIVLSKLICACSSESMRPSHDQKVTECR